PKWAALVITRLDIQTCNDSLVVLQRIEGVAVQQRRRNVRRSPLAAPDDLLCLGDVALGAVEANSQQVPRVVAAASVDHPVGRHRRRYNIRRQPRALPDNRTVRQVVTAYPIRAGDNDLSLPSVLD